jgi:hypothetical protein
LQQEGNTFKNSKRRIRQKDYQSSGMEKDIAWTKSSSAEVQPKKI